MVFVTYGKMAPSLVKFLSSFDITDTYEIP